MELGALIAGIGGVRLARGDAGVRVCDLTEDSRTALPGSLFVARGGTKADGRRFIADALGAGAVAVLTDEGGAGAAADAGAGAVVTADDVERAAALLAERFYGEPASRLRSVAVTGTNGKTTTTFLVWRMLNGAGVRCGLMGTVLVDDGREVAPATMTTPPALEVSRTLASMVEGGCAAMTMETSSHALHQRRVDAVKFRVGVFTNLTGDHLDYHGTMDNYGGAKARLFEMLPPAPEGVALVNAHDPWASRMVRDCRATVMGCAVGEAPLAEGFGWPVPYRARVLGATMRVTRLALTGPWGAIDASVPLIGAYNVMNVLQATAACHALGLSRDELDRALARACAPPGRLEPVDAPGVPGAAGASGALPAVFVDYAHSDDALANVLRSVSDAMGEQRAQGRSRLWIVFGCGGDRDRTKRPRMGRAAAEGADHVVVTSDNPRTERPGAIVDEILAGIAPGLRSKVEVQVDRERAIAFAVREAGADDVIVVAGKGHETEQILPDGAGGTVRRHFDDREVARAALARRAGLAVDGATPGAGAGARA